MTGAGASVGEMSGRPVLAIDVGGTKFEAAMVGPESFDGHAFSQVQVTTGL